jgi:hypothetical protein
MRLKTWIEHFGIPPTRRGGKTMSDIKEVKHYVDEQNRHVKMLLGKTGDEYFGEDGMETGGRDIAYQFKIAAVNIEHAYAIFEECSKAWRDKRKEEFDKQIITRQMRRAMERKKK